MELAEIEINLAVLRDSLRHNIISVEDYTRLYAAAYKGYKTALRTEAIKVLTHSLSNNLIF